MSTRAGKNDSHLTRSTGADRRASGKASQPRVAAETFDVSTKTLRRRIADGTVRGYRVGRLIRLDLEEVRNALLVVMPSAR
jgi:excisionase family DNA binding protein